MHAQCKFPWEFKGNVMISQQKYIKQKKLLLQLFM